MNAVEIGPLVFDGARFAAIVAAVTFIAVSGAVVRWMSRREAPVRVPAFALIMAWVVAARIGFVLDNRDTFAAHPLEAFAFWQGGFSVSAGMLGFGAIAVLAFLTRPRSTGPILAGAAAAFLASAVMEFAIHDPAAGQLPDTAFSAYEGPPLVLSERAGTPLAINLWATWCPPCRREMPMMMEVAKLAEGVDVVFANQGETPPQVADFLATLELGSDGILLDPNSELTSELGAMGLPTTLFFDAAGRLVAAHTGEISRAAFTTALEDLGGRVR